MRICKLAFAVMLLAVLSLVVNAQSAVTMSSSAADRSAEVKYFPNDEVLSSFEKGGILLKGANYQILTAQRQEPGQVEIHTKFTDVFYVAKGNANIVVGGKVVGENASNPEEPRGNSIEGGQVDQLAPGDVLVIPAGVPHWINKVQPPFHYFVVKIATDKP